MRSQWIRTLRGYVKIEVTGKKIEHFLNLLMDNHIEIWNVRRNKKEAMEVNILIKDYFGIRPFLKQTGCRMHIVKRFGFPFVLNKMEQRKFFLMGFLIFLAGIFLLSSVVWQVKVEGNEQIPTKEILIAAENNGVHPLQWKYKLKDPDQISNGLVKDLPGTSWIGVEIRGTQVHIKVVEAKKSEEKPLLNPRHIISTSDAVISEVIVEKGRSLVKVNQRVKQGDILISGILGDEEDQKIVVAQGDVRGIVWHEYQLNVSLSQKLKLYTGETKNRKYIVIGNRAIQISGFGKSQYKLHEFDVKRSGIQWKSYALPFGWIKEKELEVQEEERLLSKNEAKAIALQRARGDILMKSGSNTVIKDENILHEKTESGKVYMKVLFEVEQDIGKEKPIIQGE